MKVILIILLALFLTITSIFGITIINMNKDISYEDEYDIAEEDKIEDSQAIAPDSEVKTIDDIEGISRPDIDNIGAKDEESDQTEDQADSDTEDESNTQTQQDDEELTEDEENDQTEETEEAENGEGEAEEEEKIEDNTVRVFLDGDMQDGIYLGETTCGEESTEAYNLYGEDFKNTGFSFTWKNNDTYFLPGSTHYIYIYFYNAESGWDYIREEVKMPGEKECERDIVIFIDKPQDKAITETLQQINGWSVDLRNEDKPSIEKIEIYLNGPKEYGKSIGTVEYGLTRYDVAEFLDNPNYLGSGFDFNELIELEPGSKHTLFIYSYSSQNSSFNYEKREIYLSGKREEKAVVKAYIDQEKLSQDNIIEISGWAADKTLIDEYLNEKRASDADTFESESEDGYSTKKVVFTSNRDGNKNIYSINIDGTGLTRLTSYSGSDFYPEASPDGHKITYASDIGGIWQIMVMDWDGKNKKQITHNSFRCGYPSWSFDGKYIYFEAYINGDWELYRIQSDGTGQKRLTFNSTYNDWHPNGHPFKYEVIYESGVTGKENIYVMSHSGSGIRKIGGSGPRRRVPDVSNDGTKITYMRYSGNNSDIWIMDYSGQNEIKLTSNPGWDGHPSFSPDDKYIIYDEIKGSKEDLIIIDIASGAKTNITNTSSIDEDPSFLYQ